MNVFIVYKLVLEPLSLLVDLRTSTSSMNLWPKNGIWTFFTINTLLYWNFRSVAGKQSISYCGRTFILEWWKISEWIWVKDLNREKQSIKSAILALTKLSRKIFSRDIGVYFSVKVGPSLCTSAFKHARKELRAINTAPQVFTKTSFIIFWKPFLPFKFGMLSMNAIPVFLAAGYITPQCWAAALPCTHLKFLPPRTFQIQYKLSHYPRIPAPHSCKKAFIFDIMLKVFFFHVGSFIRSHLGRFKYFFICIRISFSRTYEVCFQLTRFHVFSGWKQAYLSDEKNITFNDSFVQCLNFMINSQNKQKRECHC